MKFSIKHEMTGRMRVHLSQNRMTYAQADIIPEREVISFSYCRASAMKKQKFRQVY